MNYNCFQYRIEKLKKEHDKLKIEIENLKGRIEIMTVANVSGCAIYDNTIKKNSIQKLLDFLRNVK